MMDDQKYVTWDVHKEFERRIESENQRRDDENNRQNHRLDALEATVKQISELVSSVKLLAANMDNMAKEQAKQGARLEAIEEKPAKRWDLVVTGLISAAVGALGAAVMSGMIQ